MKKLIKKNNGTITSLELVEQINFFRNQERNRSELQHKDLLKIIRDEFEEEIGEGKISPTYYKDQWNRQQPMFTLTLNQAKQVLMRESKFVRKAVIRYIEELENVIKQNNIQLNYQKLEELVLEQIREQKLLKENINQLDYKIRIDGGEQRKIQKAVGTRIYQRLEILNDFSNKNLFFQALYRDLKDRFGVASYRDIRRSQLSDALEYISGWIEPARLRVNN